MTVLALGLVGWAKTGYYGGWSKTTVTEMQVDEITGIEFPVTENRMVIGMDILGASILLAGIGFGASLAFFGVSFAFKVKN